MPKVILSVVIGKDKVAQILLGMHRLGELTSVDMRRVFDGMSGDIILELKDLERVCELSPIRWTVYQLLYDDHSYSAKRTKRQSGLLPTAFRFTTTSVLPCFSDAI
jgi:hypothetical protein